MTRPYTATASTTSSRRRGTKSYSNLTTVDGTLISGSDDASLSVRLNHGKLETYSKTHASDEGLSPAKRKLVRMVRTRAVRHAKFPSLGSIATVMKGPLRGEQVEVIANSCRHRVNWRTYDVDDVTIRHHVHGDLLISIKDLQRTDWESRMIPTSIIRHVVEQIKEIKATHSNNTDKTALGLFKRAQTLHQCILPEY